MNDTNTHATTRKTMLEIERDTIWVTRGNVRISGHEALEDPGIALAAAALIVADGEAAKPIVEATLDTIRNDTNFTEFSGELQMQLGNIIAYT